MTMIIIIVVAILITAIVIIRIIILVTGSAGIGTTAPRAGAAQGASVRCGPRDAGSEGVCSLS